MLQNIDKPQQDSSIILQINAAKLPFTTKGKPQGRNYKKIHLKRWSSKERLRYVVFLIFYRKMIESRAYSASYKPFNMMSEMIMTKTPTQCEKYHQKMIKDWASVSQIILSVSRRYRPAVFEAAVSRYSIFAKSILYNEEKRRELKEQKKNMNKEVVNGQSQKQLLCVNCEIKEEENQTAKNREQQIGLLCLQFLKKSFQVNEENQKIVFHDIFNSQEDDSSEKIPYMDIDDQDSDNDEQIPFNGNDVPEDPFNFETKKPFREDIEPDQKKEMKLYYENIIRKFALQRHLHSRNLQNMYSLLTKEKQSVKYCECVIKLLRMTVKLIQSN